VACVTAARLLQEEHMVEQSASVSKLFAALVAAQAEMRNPPKDSVNPHFKSRFADLATVLDTVKPVLAKHKLGVVQLPTEVEGVGPAMSTMLIHESGEFVRSTIGLRPGKQDPQGIGAALTYARRYGLQAVLGITADDDDDGNHSSHASRPAQQRQQAAPPQQKPHPQADKPKPPPPASVRELWERVSNSPAPQTGDELVKWVRSLDASLGRLVPDHNAGELVASVAEFLRVDPADLAGAKGKDLEAGWNNARNYVKSCDTAGAAK
jgi:hypothetical protein